MKKLLFTIIILCAFGISLEGQTIDTKFGKNRIQYHDDFKSWSAYESENFITYYYRKGKYIAQAVVQFAELDNPMIQNIFEHRMSDKIEIIVYTDLSDLKQSNIGEEDQFINESGNTKILGNKLFVYFDGNHVNLRHQIRRGVAEVYLNSMLYGSSLQEIVQNAVLLQLPEWYTKGIINFIGSPWDEKSDSALRDLFLNNPKSTKNFKKLSRDYPELAGHSLWFFIAEKYGRRTIPSLLYLTRIKRGLEGGFLYVLGSNYEQVLEQWEEYFRNKYALEKNELEALDVKNSLYLKSKSKIPIEKVRLSPDEDKFAYVSNDLGKYQIRIFDLKTNKDYLVFKGGTKNNLQETDYNYPLINWNESGTELGVIFESKDYAYVLRYDLPTQEESITYLSPEYHRVYAFDYWDDKQLIFSANTGGYSDLFKYNMITRASEKLTDDAYDDLEVKVVMKNNKKQLLFTSNRPNNSFEKVTLDDILPLDPMKIYTAEFDGKNILSMTELVKEESRDAYSPFYTSDEKIYYLTQENGVVNRKVFDTKSGTKNYLSNYISNIEAFHSTLNKTVEVHLIDEAYYVFPFDNRVSNAKDAKNIIQDYSSFKEKEGSIDEIEFDEINEGMLFQTGFEHLDKEPTDFKVAPEVSIDTLGTESVAVGNKNVLNQWSKADMIDFNFYRATAQRLKFRTDKLVTTLDNNLLFGGLDSYSADKQDFRPPPMGLLIKATLKDLFEDYIIEGGMRFPVTFDGTEFFLLANDRKNRIDKTYAYYRKTKYQTLQEGNDFERTVDLTNIFQYQWNYPIDTYQSLRATASFRLDQELDKSTDLRTLESPSRDEQRFGLKLEYVFDNTIIKDLNMLNGARLKFFGEVVKKTDIKIFDNPQFKLNSGFMTVYGADIRYYQPLDRYSILALRLSGASSFGSEKIMYYLGGMEQWLTPKFDESIPIPAGDEFAYKTIASQMRGFDYNIRNGNSYALGNAELRIPVIKYLFKRKPRSMFLRSLALTSFFDIGTAWHGKTPFRNDNPLNVDVFVDNPNDPIVTVQVNYFREPIVFGYGLGVRSQLFGYFVKVDYAWGVETKIIQEPKLYLSIGTDF